MDVGNKDVPVHLAGLLTREEWTRFEEKKWKFLNSLILSLLGFSHCFICPFRRVYSTVQKWKEHQISCLSFFKEFWHLCVPSRHSVGIHWRNLSCHSALSVSVFLQYHPNISSYSKYFPIASPPQKKIKRKSDFPKFEILQSKN